MNMERIGEVMGTVLENKELAEICQNCGAIVPFTGNQWSRTCPDCGMYISIYRPKRKISSQPTCAYGCTNGLIVYRAQVNGEIYEYAARCLCKAGMDRPETAIPFIDDVKNASGNKRVR